MLFFGRAYKAVWPAFEETRLGDLSRVAHEAGTAFGGNVAERYRWRPCDPSESILART